jgi:hypothetical protein
MKKYLLFIFLLIPSIHVFGECTILCSIRYVKKVYHPPIPISYYESQTTGRVPLFGTGRDAYYESVWSNTYSINVKFYSGYELNEIYGQTGLDDNSIVAMVNWDNGGTSFILINKNKWVTKLKYVNEKEIRYDNATGERNVKMEGYDKDGIYWEINLQ